MGGPTCLISLSAPDITATATHTPAMAVSAMATAAMAAMAATMGGTLLQPRPLRMAMATHMDRHTDRHTMVDTAAHMVGTGDMVVAMAMATLIRFPRQQPRTGQPIG